MDLGSNLGSNLGAVSTLVFDLDGVVWRGSAPIEGSVEAISQLKAAGKRCLYCTNNSSQTPDQFVEKLKSIGLEAVEDDIVTSSTATALYLSAQYTGPFLTYVIGGDGIVTAIQKIGARIVYDRDIDDDTNVDCVVAGIDRSFTYEKLNTAQRLIRRGALFVATNRDATYPVENGVIPGAGSIVAAIEAASGVTPVTIGKPRPVMLQLIQQKYKLQPQEIAFIGDRLDTDVVCARRAGVAAILVLTGVMTLPQARRAKGEIRPDAVFPDLPSIVPVVLDNSPAAPPNVEELPSYEGETASAAPVTQGAPREEAESVPVLAEPTESPVMEAPAAQDAEDVDSAFSFYSPVVPEVTEEAVATPTPAPEADASTVVTAEPSSAAEADAATSEWSDDWFADEKISETESTASTPIENDAATDADAAETTPSTPAPAAGGFEWKLD